MAEAAPRPAPSRWRAPVVLALVALGLAASYWASPIDPLQGDGFYTYLWARSLAYDFDLDLNGILPTLHPSFSFLARRCFKTLNPGKR